MGLSTLDKSFRNKIEQYNQGLPPSYKNSPLFRALVLKKGAIFA
ncbi:hypothetical protein FLACOL_02221 [Flavobacterium columnare]|uniref:Uncharacterized protein n=1 Tax=Flavobacterium columnare TaxID=996 RepID=A0A2N9PCW4_9FLAO|nr:hypothetical protein FLACOL_02221 [Flavobacterium columnare]